MEKSSIIDLILGNGFYGFIALFSKFQDAYLVVLLGKLMQNTLTRNGFEDFENIMNIGYCDDFMKRLRYELCFDFM